MYKIQTGAHLDLKLRSLDNEVSTSEPAADVACPQPTLGKSSSDIQCKAVRSQVLSGVKGAEKQSSLYYMVVNIRRLLINTINAK